jgi:hypothetical protein
LPIRQLPGERSVRLIAGCAKSRLRGVKPLCDNHAAVCAEPVGQVNGRLLPDLKQEVEKHLCGEATIPASDQALAMSLAQVHANKPG